MSGARQPQPDQPTRHSDSCTAADCAPDWSWLSIPCGLPAFSVQSYDGAFLSLREGGAPCSIAVTSYPPPPPDSLPPLPCAAAFSPNLKKSRPSRITPCSTRTKTPT